MKARMREQGVAAEHGGGKNKAAPAAEVVDVPRALQRFYKK
jgi:hypothetical protein